MRRRNGRDSLVLGLLMVGCPCDGTSGFAQGFEDHHEGSSIQPFRDQWRTEAEVPFPYLDDEGDAQITNISIGGLRTRDNFANRGDVIVQFADADTIKIELRRFTMASNQDRAEEDFADLQLWAFDDAVKPPHEIEDSVAKDCLAAGWMDGCEIRVYYDGLSQLSRAGADIRVTLPRSYRHSIEIVTEDNDEDSDYHNRGNVCVSDLPGTADITLGNGVAYVSLAEGTTPMPRCSAEDIAECEGWPDGSGEQAWAQECPCVNAIGEFGRVKVEALDAAAADMLVDIPADIWAAINLTNEASGQMRNPVEDAPGVRCDAVVDVPGYVFDPQIGDELTRDPWRNKGFSNHPSDAAIVGAGYNVQLSASDCAPVTQTEHPEDFVGTNHGNEQETHERGNLQVCSGCIRAQSCEDLLEALPAVPL